MAQEKEPTVRNDPPRRSSLRTAAWSLGLAGLLPFVLMTALLVYAGRDFIAYPQLVLSISGYAAVILSFLGGIRWGAALWLEGRGRLILVFAVLTSLAGWLILFVPTPWMFAAFAVAFLLQGLWDVAAARRGLLPPWFGRLRVALTAAVVLSMAICFFATYR